MIEQQSYARITLALDIIKKLEQGPYKGYHELQIIKHQIDLQDTITVEPSIEMQIKSNDSRVPRDERNICWKAVDLLKKHCDKNENVSITIQKRIPVEGGLAGGSTNAATVLSMCNTLWECKLSNQKLIEISRDLGMDVAYYFKGGTAFDTETTGMLRKIDTSLRFDFVVAIPEFGVSTAKAYQDINYSTISANTLKTMRMEQAFLNNDREAVISHLHNDFEHSVFKKYPALAHIRELFLKAGCLNAVLSGSGSSMLGVATDKDHADWTAKHMQCRCIVTSSLEV